jgi:hypothetical protein
MVRGNRILNGIVLMVASSVFTACTSDLRLKNQPSLTVASGNQQTALASTALPQPLKVLVKDYAGRILKETLVNWTIENGDGTLSSSTSVSDSNGYASVNYTFGPSITQNVVTASVAGSSISARFELTNTLPTTPWIRQIGTTAMSGVAPAGNDTCRAIAVDSAGNSVCVGFTASSLLGPNAGSTDFFIRKYNPSGATLWSVQSGGAGADNLYGVVLDSSQNIYVAGSTANSLADTVGGSSDVLVAKYSPTGTLLWMKQFGATSGYDSSGNEYLTSIAMDPSGNIVCGGYTTGSFAETNGGGTDLLAIKLDPSGTVLWTRQIGTASTPVGQSSSGNDYFQSVISDSSGNLYLGAFTGSSLGETFGGGTYDGAVIKLSSSGSVLWIKQFGTTSTPVSAAGTEYVYGIAVGPANDLYVVGNTDGSFAEANGGSTDGLLIRLSTTDGHFIWAKQWGSITLPSGGSTAGAELFTSIKILGNQIFLAGHSSGDFFETNDGAVADAIFMKLDLAGTIQWSKQLGATSRPVGSSTSSLEAVFGIDIDRSGNWLVGMRTNSSLADTAGGLGDFTVLKINPNGDFGL